MTIERLEKDIWMRGQSFWIIFMIEIAIYFLSILSTNSAISRFLAFLFVLLGGAMFYLFYTTLFTLIPKRIHLSEETILTLVNELQ